MKTPLATTTLTKKKSTKSAVKESREVKEPVTMLKEALIIEDVVLSPAEEQLLSIGRERGYVTYDEILEAFPEAETNIDQLDEIFATLTEHGIELGEAPEDEGPAPPLVASARICRWAVHGIGEHRGGCTVAPVSVIGDCKLATVN